MEEIFTELRNAEKGVYSMKAKKLLSWFGVLIMMMSTVAVMAGCNHANDNKGNTADGLTIQPTGKADPALKDTRWKADNDYLYFASEGNTAHMYDFESVYTVNASTVSFDFSKSAKAWSTLTVKTYIDWQITMGNKYIAELEELAKKEQDATKKKEYEDQIERIKNGIKGLNDMTTEEKAEFEKELNESRKLAKAILPHAKFEGTLNDDKTELTIEKFPVLDKDGTCKVEKAVFKKQN